MSALAACGGGGTSPTPHGPTPVPTNTSDRPAASGDAFSYAGTMTEEFVNAPVPATDGFVTPNPNPTVSSTITTAVTQSVTVSVASSFNGVSNPYDFKTAETDVIDGGLKSATVDSDEYYQYATSGGSTPIYFLGSTTTNSDGVSFGTTIGSGNGLVDVIPETPGTLSPANNAAATTTETDPDGFAIATAGPSEQRVTNADGSYTEEYANADTTSDGNISTAVANADGSGSYAYEVLTRELSNLTYSAPASGIIAITFSVPDNLVNGAASPSATPFVFPPIEEPVWYPQPVTLSKQTIVDSVTSSLPSACNVPASLLKSGVGHTIVATTNTVDPVFGELDANTQTTYTEQGTGVVCEVLSDAVSLYYDLSGQTQAGPSIFVGETPVETVTTNETLGLTAATIEGLSSIHRMTAAGGRLAVDFRPSTAHFRAVLAKKRAARHAAYRRALIARLKGDLR